MFCQMAVAQYTTDVLGNGYVCRTIEQPKDYDGKVVCTIVKKEAPITTKKAIVYVHGYNDYFFQQELGDKANANGYNFYAVDLRKYGRSLLDHQDAFFCKKMDEYFPDIDTTIAIARREGNETIVLMGHSTGGLTTPLYLNSKSANAKHVNALVLNSPFLDWNMSKFMEGFLVPCVSVMGAVFKRVKVQGAEKEVRGYAQSLLKQYHGEWDFNTSWKMDKGHPKRSGWIRAINRGHKKLRRHSNISCPILAMHSDTTINESGTWNEGFRRADVVLDVNDIEKFSKKLGKNLTQVTIKGGKHDLLLSEPSVRDEAYNTIFDWLKDK